MNICYKVYEDTLQISSIPKHLSFVMEGIVEEMKKRNSRNLIHCLDIIVDEDKCRIKAITCNKYKAEEVIFNFIKKEDNDFWLTI